MVRSSVIEVSEGGQDVYCTCRHTRRDAPFFQFWHLQGMLEHGQGSVEKLVRIEVMSRERPSAYGVLYESFPFISNFEFTEQHVLAD